MPPSEYYYNEFIEQSIRPAGELCACEPADCGCKMIGTYVGRMFDLLRSLKNLTVLHHPVSWVDFPNNWPPEKVGNDYKITSRPQEITLPGSRCAKIQNLSITIRFIMDTQGYCIPRGFKLEINGFEETEAGDDSESKIPPTNSSSSSSSAYSTNASYEEGGPGF